MLVSININNVIFSIDPQYELIMDLIDEKFKKQVFIIDQLFGKNDTLVKALIEQMIQDEASYNDRALIFFLSMALQSYGEVSTAKNILLRLYQTYPTDLLARCAYANGLIFSRKIQEIPAVFRYSFDLDKIYTNKEQPLPLVVFLQFMSIAFIYYFLLNDVRCLQFAHYAEKVAPEHQETKGMLDKAKIFQMENNFN